MITMKKITLLALVTFVGLTGAILLGGKLGSKDSRQPRQEDVPTKTTLGRQNRPYAAAASAPESTGSGRVAQLKAPKINIKNLESSLVEPLGDSFTAAQVAKHSSANDCYLIIDNRVYDVSSYISYHPGGARVITSRCGTEVSGIFARIHSNRAWDLLKKYKIGNINTTKRDPTPQILAAISTALEKANPDAEVIKVRPRKDFYVAKIIFNGKLYELHINDQGQLIKEEIEDDEADWTVWESDRDDR
jgi:cytochrome b involved in lipid metabolism